MATSFTRGRFLTWGSLVFMIAALGTFACGSGNPCGCGASTGAPLSQHDLSFAGDHTVDTQCVCRCGDGTQVAFPADQPCAVYETRCEGPLGERGNYRCL